MTQNTIGNKEIINPLRKHIYDAANVLEVFTRRRSVRPHRQSVRHRRYHDARSRHRRILHCVRTPGCRPSACGRANETGSENDAARGCETDAVWET